MERIVYFLGAGFSAPLGLPVMNNFLETSKDLYFSDPKKFKHFKKVFDTIKDMSMSSDYYNTDLFNIEEILSILEMQRQLGKKRGSQWYRKLIFDVIESSTPTIKPKIDLHPHNWFKLVFGDNEIQRGYGYFIASLLNLSIRASAEKNSIRPIHCTKIAPSKVSYSVISLNYDLILENYVKYMIDSFEIRDQFEFCREAEQLANQTTFLVKLHGSVDSGVIVPPTWNKNFHPEIVPQWKLAYELLTKANHIRIIGYSLPDSDAYIKYLLKAAISHIPQHIPHIKTIDILCLDNNGEVEKRFENFIRFPKCRYKCADVKDYLGAIYQKVNERGRPDGTFQFRSDDGYLEKSHLEFFE